MKKHFLGKFSGTVTLLVMCLIAGMLCTYEKVEAKTISANRTTEIYSDGRYVYYAGGGYGPGMGITRIDTKTGKTKKIVGCKYKKRDTNGVVNVTMKGNYLYYTWDHYYGTYSEGEFYIYRVQKNGKKAKKLAMGSDPVIVGNRIYYKKRRLVGEYDEVYTKVVGWASMKLDGSGKRNELGIKFSWKDASPSNSVGNKKATTGNNYYYTKNNSTVLMRMNLKNGKTNKVYTCKAGEEILYVVAHKKAAIINVYCPGQTKDLKIIYVSQDGKKKIQFRRTHTCG